MTVRDLRRLGVERLVLLGRSLPPVTPPLGDWHLATELARRLPVLYVAPPIWPPPRTRGVGGRRDRPTEAQTHVDHATGMVVLQPTAPPGSDRARAARLGDLVLARQLRQHLGDSAARDTVLVVSDPRRGVLSGVARRLSVYWRRDRFAFHGGTDHVRHLATRDRALMRRSDLVLGISPSLTEEATASGARAAYVPNGCDFTRFSRPEIRAWRPGSRPRVGYVGGLSWRVDAELLSGLARRRPDWDVHVYGPGSAELPSLPNLLVHGPVSYADLPEVMASLHVGLIPYHDNPFNRASFPLKTFEYLAAGVPVVSSDIPALADLHPFVRLARDLAGFEEAVAGSLSPDYELGEARALASQHTWSHRADTFVDEVTARLTGSAERDRAGVRSRSGPRNRAHPGSRANP